MVRGSCKDATSFQEEATTLLVNANGALLPLHRKLTVGDTVFVFNKLTRREQECRVVYIGDEVPGKSCAGVGFWRPAPNFWRVNRREGRVAKTIPVKVRGIDQQGQPYTQSADVIDISRHGARLDGIGFVAAPGETIEIRRFWRSSRYRIVWVGAIGTPESGQAGAFAVDPNKKLWGADLP